MSLLALTWACGDEVIIQAPPADTPDGGVNNGPGPDGGPDEGPACVDDGVCSMEEMGASPQCADCMVGPQPTCNNNGVCDIDNGEDAQNCAADCPFVQEPVDCSNYTFEGQTYNCEMIDFCSPNQDFLMRTACCECDRALCNPQTDCGNNVVCGDGLCTGGETTDTCAQDCPRLDQVESCMGCHNGAMARNDYSGPGLQNPHPFAGAEYVACTGCHGGNPRGAGRLGSHVPNPPFIGNKQNQINDPVAYFNKLSWTGIDKLQPATYTSPDRPGESFTNLDYLQFLNPGDLRVVTEGRGCGANGCHGDEHALWLPRNFIATETGFWSNTRMMIGVDNAIAEHRGVDSDSLADYAPRAVTNPAFNPANKELGEVGRLVEVPEVAQFNGPMRDNGVYDANTLANHIINANQDPQRPNRVRSNSPLETLIMEQVSITCGDCHLYSAGQNNRYADFRSSGCTACHMEYSYDGRSRSGDPNVNRQEPANPDAIAAPERPHIDSHQIRNVAKFLNNGTFVRGISDRACVGCHQGSNRTVLQYWGIRLDQNQDLANNFQYPANPNTFQNTAQDTRLYDPAVANNTFNGRNANQYILLEDYDGDGRDDTPADIHYEVGMGCIDCHGSFDVHGGVKGNPNSGKIRSRMDQHIAIQCESCHGSITEVARTAECETYTGQRADCAVDVKGNPLRHVNRDPNGNFFLTSRLNGQRHYIPQTYDVVVNTNKQNPFNQQLLYSPKASYAMGRADGNPANGVGPLQQNPNLFVPGFAHTDTMDCASCHASWMNNCVGCHLANQYDVNPNNYFFSNITGERILLFQKAADFTYISPVAFQLGVNSRGKITTIAPGMQVFYRHVDLNGNESNVFAFNDRLGNGNNPNNGGRNAFPALQKTPFMPHSIRGKVVQDKEGPRYCVACHINVDALNNFGAEYDAFRADYANNNFANLDFALLQQHIGQNSGNQLNSPIWVHMVSGLGSGLYLFDATGCPVNPLDANANRQYCPDGAPADNFDPNNVVYDLDRIVEFNGVNNSSSSRPRINLQGVQRIGAANPQMAGPLGGPTIQKLMDPNVGRVLDSYLDANGNAQGGAANFLQ